MIDELRSYAYNDYQVGKFKVHNPTLREIADVGESNFWQMVQSITATRYDCRLYLWSLGIDFDTIHWWQMVCQRAKDKQLSDCRLIMPEINFQCFIPCIEKDLGEMVLFDPLHNIKITEQEFIELQVYWRTTLNLSPNDIRNGNEHTRKWRLQYELDKLRRKEKMGVKDEFHSVLRNYISALTNCPGFKYSWHTVWNLPINVFIDSLRRLQMIRQSDNLLNGIYSGNVSYKDLHHKEELDWLREIQPITTKTN